MHKKLSREMTARLGSTLECICFPGSHLHYYVYAFLALTAVAVTQKKPVLVSFLDAQETFQGDGCWTWIHS